MEELSAFLRFGTHHSERPFGVVKQQSGQLMNLILNLNVSAILGIGFPHCSLPILGCQNNVNRHAETCCNWAIHSQPPEPLFEEVRSSFC